MVVGGSLADRWVRITSLGRISTSAIGVTMFLPALFGVGNATTLSVAIGGLIVFGIGWGFFDCNNMPILAQITRPEWLATGYDLMNLVSIMGIAGLSHSCGRKAGGWARARCGACAGWRACGCRRLSASLCGRGHSTKLPTKATHRNHVWTWDFSADATMRGGALRMLTVHDENSMSTVSK